MKTWSLRIKLALWSALVTALVLLTFGGVAAAGLYFRQQRTIEKSLASDSRVFFRELSEDGKPNRDDQDEAVLLLKGATPLYGYVFGPTRGAVTHLHPDNLRGLAEKWPGVPGYSTIEVGKRDYRLGVFVDGEFTLILAADLHPLNDMVEDLLRDYLLALPFVLVVGAAGSWWLSRRALQPIEAITRAAGAITTERLDARLQAPLAADEIGRLTQVLNAMFDRLQRGFEQATRFTADASHELRTPLTILRGDIEEALRTGGLDVGQERLLVDLLEQTSGLQKIADNLLLLARFDAGKSPMAQESVAFGLLVQDAAEDAELLASTAKLSIHTEVAPEVRVKGDAHLLRRVLLNLIDNAVRYNRAGGAVWLALRREADEVVLVVANTGPGIPANRRGELFQRFFRLNADRNRGTGGSGLGLSLCREIVVAHGGRIALGQVDNDRTEFVVRLPVGN